MTLFARCISTFLASAPDATFTPAMVFAKTGPTGRKPAVFATCRGGGAPALANRLVDNNGAFGDGPFRTPPRHGPDGHLDVNLVNVAAA
jgi:hypothetical protein